METVIMVIMLAMIIQIFTIFLKEYTINSFKIVSHLVISKSTHHPTNKKPHTNDQCITSEFSPFQTILPLLRAKLDLKHK